MFLTEIVQLIARTLNFSLFLRNSYTYKMKYDHIYPHGPCITPSVLSPPTLCLSFYDPLNPASAAHMYIRVGLSSAARMCMGVGPATKAWDSYQWPHPQESISPSPGSVH